MDLKKRISPLLLIGLFAAFGLVCLMVALTKGKRAKWIARKMKIGAAILSLTAVSTGCPPIVTCYDPIMPNNFHFDQMDYNQYQIVADFPNDSVLSGTINERHDENFGFEVIKDDTSVIQTGDIIASDGKFDTSEERFELMLDSKIDTGLYKINITLPEQNDPNIRYSHINYQLKVK